MLRGSVSTVLRRPAKSMGNSKLWPPTESKPLNGLPKKLSQLITSARRPAVPILMQIFRRGLLGKWVKYNVKLFLRTYIRTYTFFFRWTTHRSDPSTDFDAWWLKRREITQGCAFLGLQKVKVTFNPLLGPPNVDFWRKNGLSTENRLQWALPRVKYP